MPASQEDGVGVADDDSGWDDVDMAAAGGPTAPVQQAAHALHVPATGADDSP